MAALYPGTPGLRWYSPRTKRENLPCSARVSKPADLLQAVAVEPSKIVGKGLPEVVTVVERSAGNELSPAVDSFDEDVLAQRRPIQAQRRGIVPS